MLVSAHCTLEHLSEIKLLHILIARATKYYPLSIFLSKRLTNPAFVWHKLHRPAQFTTWFLSFAGTSTTTGEKDRTERDWKENWRLRSAHLRIWRKYAFMSLSGHSGFVFCIFVFFLHSLWQVFVNSHYWKSCDHFINLMICVWNM